MKYLLDTHTILWYLFGDSRLSQSARKIIESHICFYSYASFWEISIKQSKKKLEFEHTVFEIDEMCRTAGFRKLPITLDDFKKVKNELNKELSKLSVKIPRDAYERIVNLMGLDYDWRDYI